MLALAFESHCDDPLLDTKHSKALAAKPPVVRARGFHLELPGCAGFHWVGELTMV